MNGYTVRKSVDLIWDSTWKNLVSLEVCKQQRPRPACASAQSDQRLCYLLIVKYHILTCFERNFTILASLRSFKGDWFESRFFGNPEDRFSHVEAHLITYAKPSRPRNI